MPDCEIYQYDCAFFIAQLVLISSDIVSSDKMVTVPIRFNMEPFKLLHTDIVLAVQKLPVNETGSVVLKVPYGVRLEGSHASAPWIFKIKLMEVAVRNPEALKCFIVVNYLQENSVLTAIMASSVIVWMEPLLNHPFNIYSLRQL
ncbi:hypothetical protein EV421DRAFT_1940575 [Armillaria borealis]|uniref:Uncharacterized protein n=1 Tax=Armillaria borealis TaxID=47425 RepID=A0AA39MD57_9AGAR|nr:hypothetical protein EV421DRAFT_1940575 [Armillaria borealis]